MAIYSLAVRTTGASVTTPALEVIGAAAIGYRLLELGMSINAATASVYGYGRPAAIGVTPTTPVAVLAEDGGNTTAGNSTTALAWGTAPTAPTNFLRRVSLPATVGAGIIWTFPRGIVVLKALTSVLWNITANSVADVWVVVDE
jgi:hypothetical protein